jgi:glutamate synthase (NADPH/NADH) small chain
VNKEEEVKEKIKKVAVIGSGPSGLTISSALLNHGVDVTLYESFHLAGGVLIYGIPDSRLPKSVVKNEVDLLINKGLKIIYNTKVGRDIKLSKLQQDYDAVYIAAGAGIPNFIGLEGENSDRVYSGHDFIARFKVPDAYSKESLQKIKQSKNVIILGAGNVAMDASRTAIEAGAKKVNIVYRRSEKEMPARAYEVEDAKEMGAIFNFLLAPKKILSENGTVSGVVFVKTVLGEVDVKGRQTAHELPNSELVMPCDTVIECIGAGADSQLTDGTGLQIDSKGLISVDEKGKTNLHNVYAGGDIVTGNKIVPLAMSAGRKAAKSILESFGITVKPIEKEMQAVMTCISPVKKQ